MNGLRPCGVRGVRAPLTIPAAHVTIAPARPRRTHQGTPRARLVRTAKPGAAAKRSMSASASRVAAASWSSHAVDEIPGPVGKTLTDSGVVRGEHQILESERGQAGHATTSVK